MAEKKRKTGMTDEHKAALAAGRSEGRAVRNYLEALEANRPKRGRKRTSDSVKKRLAAIEQELTTADTLNRVKLVQERMDLQDELAAMSDKADLVALESAFAEHAKSYSERRGISYAAWREVGVPAAVLKKAGITRSM
jgi:uncharacterized protein YdcH (DUF465 family)